MTVFWRAGLSASITECASCQERTPKVATDAAIQGLHRSYECCGPSRKASGVSFAILALLRYPDFSGHEPVREVQRQRRFCRCGAEWERALTTVQQGDLWNE